MGHIHVHYFGEYVAVHTDIENDPEIFGMFLRLAIEEYVVRFTDKEGALRDILSEIPGVPAEEKLVDEAA